MRFLIVLVFCLPLSIQANILIQYDLNYSSQEASATSSKYDQNRTFHKGFMGASVNANKSFYLGWNINSWSSSHSVGTGEDSYTILEMGPRLQWFLDDNYNWYLSGEWNPYARGDRVVSTISSKVSGSSIGIGAGYRFKLSRFIGIGASIHYHSLSIDEEKIGSNETNVSDSVTNLMPMLEISILTK